MGKKIIFLFTLLLFVGLSQNVKATNVTFEASAPSAVAMGTRFNLTYILNVVNGADLRLPPEIMENFNILSGPNTSVSRGTQIVNGQRATVSSATYTFILTAKQEGTFNLSAATIKIGNSTYKSNEIAINVLPPDQTQQQQGGGAQQQQGNALSTDNLFMQMIVSNRNVYEQEGFLVTFKVYAGPSVNLASINNAKFPEFEGFLAQDIELNEIQVQMENYNGRNFTTAIIKQTILYPQRPGQLSINSGSADVTVRVRNQAARGRSMFEDFFDTYQNMKVELTSQPTTINVKPLPTGKPASFSGAVGNFSMSSEINRTELKANEAITVKVAIRGNGNIRLLKNPDIVFPNDFEVYDPKVDNNIRVTTAGASGTKTIEYMAIPRFAGDFEIPAINFSYFDTKSETYKTLSTESYKLRVERGEGGSEAPVMSNFTNRENVRFVGSDIRYIKTNKPHFISNKDIFFGSFLYVMAYLMIAVLFIVFFVIYRKQVKENSNLALVRTKKANKTAVKRLKQAEKLLKENNEEAFYEEVLRALWGYLSDKLNMPQSELTKDNVAAELAKYGVGDELSTGFLEIINTCEFARYAPNKTSGAMDKLFSETIDAIGNMENTIKK